MLNLYIIVDYSSHTLSCHICVCDVLGLSLNSFWLSQLTKLLIHTFVASWWTNKATLRALPLLMFAGLFGFSKHQRCSKASSRVKLLLKALLSPDNRVFPRNGLNKNALCTGSIIPNVHSPGFVQFHVHVERCERERPPQYESQLISHFWALTLLKGGNWVVAMHWRSVLSNTEDI